MENLEKDQNVIGIDDSDKITDKKTCFIITPIGKEDSDIRREVDGIIDEVINPILEQNGYDTNNVSHRKDSSSITGDIIKSIYDSDLCIANLKGNNANVMYELALRHSAGKPVIIITDNLGSLPFDINDQRCIEYKNDMKGALILKQELQRKIDYINNHIDEVSNPIYDNLQKVIISDPDIPQVSLKLQDSIELMLEDMKSIKEDIFMITKRVNRMDTYENRYYSSDISEKWKNRDILQYYLAIMNNRDGELTYEQIREILPLLEEYIYDLLKECETCNDKIQKRDLQNQINTMQELKCKILECAEKIIK